MSSKKERMTRLFPCIDPAHFEDALQAFAQLTPVEQAALRVKTPYVLELIRQGKLTEDIIRELSQDPLVAAAYHHLAQIPEKPVE